MKLPSIKRPLQLVVGVIVTALFVWLISRNVDGGEVARVLRRASPYWIIVAIAFFIAGYACRIARWRSMLLQDNPAVSWADCATPFMGSIAANNVLPFRAGDVLRVYGLSGHLGVPKSALLASLLAERLLDLFSLLMAFAFCLLLFDLQVGTAGQLAEAGSYGVLAIALAVLALLLFPRLLEWPASFVLALFGKVAPAIHRPLHAFAEHLFATLKHLASGSRMLFLLLWSMAVWILEGFVFWASAKAIPDILEPVVGFLALPIATLATLLPSTPGYVGTFDFFAIKSAEALGNSPEAATAFALLVHLVLWLPATIIGGACVVSVWLRRRNSAQSDRKSHFTS